MSQRDGVTESIDGHEYTVYMLAPMISHDLLTDVAKMVGPAQGPVIDTGGLDKKVLRDTINRKADMTHVDGKPLKPIFDEHFRGGLHVMYQWLGFAMKVQWGKSLSALGSVVTAQGAEVAATESPSPSTSDG